jgi:hypothetical protein
LVQPYIRLQEEFIFLAVILEAHSRRVIAGLWIEPSKTI